MLSSFDSFPRTASTRACSLSPLWAQQWRSWLSLSKAFVARRTRHYIHVEDPQSRRRLELHARQSILRIFSCTWRSCSSKDDTKRERKRCSYEFSDLWRHEATLGPILSNLLCFYELMRAVCTTSQLHSKKSFVLWFQMPSFEGASGFDLCSEFRNFRGCNWWKSPPKMIWLCRKWSGMLWWYWCEKLTLKFAVRECCQTSTKNGCWWGREFALNRFNSITRVHIKQKLLIQSEFCHLYQV